MADLPTIPTSPERPPASEADYENSQRSWREARSQSAAGIARIQAAILKTRDPRGPEIATGLDRVLRSLPDVGLALELLGTAEERQLASEVTELKELARRTVQLCSYYLRSDRLIALLRENPFTPIHLERIFATALQVIQTELK